MSPPTIGHAARLAQVEREAWDALAAGSSFYSSYDWLRLVEADPGAETTYLLARDAGGALVGALPCARVTAEGNAFYRPAAVLPGVIDEATPYLLLGSRRGYRGEILVSPGLQPAAARAVRAELLGAAAELAGSAVPIMLYAPEGCRRALAGAAGGLRALLLTPDASIAARGPTFAEHVAGLPGRMRKRVEREVDDFRRGGYEVGREAFADCWEETVPLLASVQSRYGHAADPDALRASLGRQARHVGSRGVTFTCRRGGRLAGFALAYPWGGVLHGRMVGFDYAALSGHAEYFNLAYNETMRYACEHGLRTLHAGIEGYAPKVLRGAVLSPLWALVPPGACTERAALAHNRRRLAELHAALAGFPSALAAPAWQLDTAADPNEGAS